ncbi:MAG TPA: methyltransferase domain-containing protein [Armatimonadota bacterium]|nr:methyltransferase domain-containing protein [Armatimonadota bacterium]
MTDRVNMRQAWNRISPGYQADYEIPTDFAHYGPHCPNEDQLKLVGEVRGRRVLEIGCGGGQCAIAFAKRGAVATGIDISDAQIEFARELARREGVAATFLRGNIEDLPAIPEGSQDVVFSAYALNYVRRIGRCLAEVARVLRPGGLLVFSCCHPFWLCLAEDEMTVTSSYHDRAPDEWEWERGDEPLGARVREYRHTVGDWFRRLRAAGLEVVDIIEPEPVESGSGQDWGGHYAPQRQRIVPATIIWKAHKPEEARP